MLLAPEPHAASSNVDSALPTNKREDLNFIRFLLTFQIVAFDPQSGLLNELAPETSKPTGASSNPYNFPRTPPSVKTEPSAPFGSVTAQQATLRDEEIETSAGSSTRHRSIASGHRGAKRHPFIEPP